QLPVIVPPAYTPPNLPAFQPVIPSPQETETFSYQPPAALPQIAPQSALGAGLFLPEQMQLSDQRIIPHVIQDFHRTDGVESLRELKNAVPESGFLSFPK